MFFDVSKKKCPSDTINRNQRAKLDLIFMAENKFDLPSLERLIDGVYTIGTQLRDLIISGLTR